MNQTPIIVCGAYGRMGHAVVDLALKSQDFLVRSAVVRPGSSDTKPAHWPVPIDDSLERALAREAQSFGPRAVIIDFSHHGRVADNLRVAQHYGHGILVATTGHSEQNEVLIEDAANQIPVVFAPNTSLMANLMIAFSKLAASAISNLDVSILDIHHAHKKDAPSGTAHALAKAITEGRQRHGQALDISIRSLRVGQVAGDHTAYFFSDFERLELTHRVTDRRVFAQGALLAAQFLFGRRPGLYDMNDVLNLKLTIENGH